MANLDPKYKLVETAIARLGVDPAKCRGQKPGQWSLIRGSVKVWLDLWHIEKENRAYFQVMSPVVKIPTEQKEQFYEELLKINDKLFGVAFSLYKENAWIKVIREVDGMDENEAFAMITRVGNYADKYDDELKNKYFPITPGSRSDI